MRHTYNITQTITNTHKHTYTQKASKSSSFVRLQKKNDLIILLLGNISNANNYKKGYALGTKINKRNLSLTKKDKITELLLFYICRIIYLHVRKNLIFIPFAEIFKSMSTTIQLSVILF